MDAKFLSELKEYVAIPSVSADPRHKKDCARAAQWMAAKLKRMGLSAKLIKTAGHPVVMGTYRPHPLTPSLLEGENNSGLRPATPYTRETNGAQGWNPAHLPPPGIVREGVGGRIPHILIYGHYDVQPVDPLKLWKTPPFTMTKIGGKLFGRGVADDKSSVLALLFGLEKALAKNPNLKITCLIEGEEEGGSSHLPEVLKKIRKQLEPVDFVAISDTTSPAPDHLSITTGTRGVLALEMTMRGLTRDLHSGHGGPIPNAVRELTRVLGGVYDAQGWVNIPGFYDGALPATRAGLADIKRAISAKEFAREIGALGYYPMNGKSPFAINRFFPSFEINGIMGGYQGPGGKTIVPATASAKITCRVAAGQNPGALQKKVARELQKRVNRKLFSCEVILHGDPCEAYALRLNAKERKTQSKFFLKAMRLVEEGCRTVTGNPLLHLCDGGSVPILATFKKILGADALALGLYSDKSLIHSPNENVEVKFLENGIKVWERVFKGLR
jgi:acetylornithine deacetylase/succinyl-diaminopimelate desuccinylase-like protein